MVLPLAIACCWIVDNVVTGVIWPDVLVATKVALPFWSKIFRWNIFCGCPLMIAVEWVLLLLLMIVILLLVNWLLSDGLDDRLCCCNWCCFSWCAVVVITLPLVVTIFPLVWFLSFANATLLANVKPPMPGPNLIVVGVDGELPLIVGLNCVKIFSSFMISLLRSFLIASTLARCVWHSSDCFFASWTTGTLMTFGENVKWLFFSFGLGNGVFAWNVFVFKLRCDFGEFSTEVDRVVDVVDGTAVVTLLMMDGITEFGFTHAPTSA